MSLGLSVDLLSEPELEQYQDHGQDLRVKYVMIEDEAVGLVETYQLHGQNQHAKFVIVVIEDLDGLTEEVVAHLHHEQNQAAEKVAVVKGVGAV